jgi:hypothetical protein
MTMSELAAVVSDLRIVETAGAAVEEVTTEAAFFVTFFTPAVVVVVPAAAAVFLVVLVVLVVLISTTAVGVLVALAASATAFRLSNVATPAMVEGDDVMGVTTGVTEQDIIGLFLWMKH